MLTSILYQNVSWSNAIINLQCTITAHQTIESEVRTIVEEKN